MSVPDLEKVKEDLMEIRQININIWEECGCERCENNRKTKSLVDQALAELERDEEEKEEYMLCYIEGDSAYFTTCPLGEQWGDDWNDVPYEHNAGRPYEWSESSKSKPYKIKKIKFEGGFLQPSEGFGNSPYSVEEINKGNIPWLKSESWIKEQTRIYAGCLLGNFIKLVNQIEGTIYFPFVCNLPDQTELK